MLSSGIFGAGDSAALRAHSRRHQPSEDSSADYSRPAFTVKAADLGMVRQSPVILIFPD